MMTLHVQRSRSTRSSTPAGWTGAAANIVVRVNNTNPDRVLVYDAANATQLPLGTVNRRATTTWARTALSAPTGTPSSMVRSGSTITVTLGTQSGNDTMAAAAATSVWTPSSTTYDRAGNAGLPGSATESGVADKEF